MDPNVEVCGIHGCARRARHRGMHTPNPSMTTLDFDHHYESVVVRIVMRGIRRGHIDPAPEHLQRWTDREVACGLRPA